MAKGLDKKRPRERLEQQVARQTTRNQVYLLPTGSQGTSQLVDLLEPVVSRQMQKHGKLPSNAEAFWLVPWRKFSPTGPF